MEFWRLYRVIRQRKKVILAVTLAALIAAMAAGQHKISDYSSTVVLTIPTAQQFYFVSGSGARGNSGVPSGESLAGLATDMVRSREVADRVIQQLQLSTPPEELENRINVARDPNASLIRITAEGTTPQGAVALANAVADNLVAYNQEMQRGQATLAREFVEKQVTDTQDRLRAAEDALLAYQQKNDTVLAAGPLGQLASVQAQLEQTNLDIQEANARVASLSGRMNTLQPTRTDQTLYLNPVAQQLEQQLIGLQVQLTSQLAVHTESYPAVVTIEAMIKEIKNELNTQIQKTVSTQQIVHNPIFDALSQERTAAETDLLALKAKQEALNRALAASVHTLPTAQHTQLDEARLSRTASILGTQLMDLSGQLASARVREQEVASLDSLSVLDHARSATQSPFAGLRFKLTLGLVLGLLAGLGAAFFLEYLDNSLKTPEAAERLLGVPALVAIPRHNPPFDEAYRMLRINLASRERGADGADAIMLTAPRPRAGTSTVTANLARAFAQAGRRTIVVDAALAGPAQHRMFKVPNERGLVQLLDGQAELDDVLMPAARNLWVVPAGADAALESGALLGSPSMEAALRALRQRGDIVLLDTSPAGAFADPFDVAPHTSGVVLVLDANEVPRGAEEQIKLQFERLGAPVLGAVLTKVAPSSVDSYFYQERFYRKPSRRSLVPAAASVVVILAAAAMCVHLATSPSNASRRPATELQQVRGTVDAAVSAMRHTGLARIANKRR